MGKIALHWQILIGLVLGILFGFFFSEYAHYVSWLGDLFIHALKMIIVPLVLTSIVSGVANLGGKLGRLGGKTLLYYISTSLFAILTGLLLSNLFMPSCGKVNIEVASADAAKMAKISAGNENFSILQMIIDIIPTNVFNALATGNMLQIIFFSILLGIFLPRLSEKYRNGALKFFNGGFELMMKITLFIVTLAPIGVFGLMAKVIGQQAGDTDKFLSTLGALGCFMLIVLAGLFIHAMITLPALLKFIGGVNPIKHFQAMRTPLLTAFSTSSSSATLPLTLTALEQEAGVSKETTSFVVPLGATVNMDGTALYELVGVMFIAQAYGLEMGLTQQLVVVFTALMASIGAAAIPMAGLVMMTVILTAIGLPLEGVGLILAVDRILDMFRTAVNVWSDSCGTALIASTEGEELNY